MLAPELLEACWAALGADPGAAEQLEINEPGAWLGGPLAVDALAVGAVGAELLAAAELAQARGLGRPVPSLSAQHVAASFISERHLQRAGQPAPAAFAPLSRFVRCRDGWARTHGNYPHHAAALTRALNLEPSDDRDLAAHSLERAAGELDATAVEDMVVAAGGCAAAVRTAGQWSAHEAGRAAGELALVEWDRRLQTVSGRRLGAAAQRARPAAGVRVLDLTRVIAGPVAGRSLAALGADVLRVDPPQLPEIPEQHLDTSPGKRTAIVDLADAEPRETLLAGADVVLIGYRPGSLARYGLDADALAERHPRLVQVRLSAWGHAGPWRERRGFDSLVQAASGIAAECASADGTPGTLPAQALDHGTGHLMAAAALRALAARERGEGIAPARLALAGTARWLLGAARPSATRTEATGHADAAAYRVSFGELALIGPPGALDGTALRWAHGPRPFGTDEPRWGSAGGGR